MKASEERKVYLPALGAVALWSTVAVAFKLALRELDPIDLVALAAFFSWVSLAAVLLTRTISGTPPAAFTRRNFLFSAALGLLNPLAYYWVLFAAYDRLPAQAAQPLNYTWPLFLAILAAPLAGKRPTARDLLGLSISLIGVVLIARRPGSGSEDLNPLGVALALGSGIIWAFSWLTGTRLRIDGTLRLFFGFSAALIVLSVIWLRRGAAFPSSPLGWFSVVWVGFFEMGITFLLWNTALERSNRPARIGNLVYLGPFISLLWIYLILGEAIRPSTLAGLAVIVSGILMGQGRKRNQQQQEK